MAKRIPCFKIVNVAPDGSYKTLYHGVNRTRVLPKDKWVTAERKWVGEGGVKYWTGFHVIKSLDECNKYLKRFSSKKEPRIIVPIFAKNLRPKVTSRGEVFLAEQIMVC